MEMSKAEKVKALASLLQDAVTDALTELVEFHGPTGEDEYDWLITEDEKQEIDALTELLPRIVDIANRRSN